MASTTTTKKVTGFFPLHITWKSLTALAAAVGGPVLAMLTAANTSGATANAGTKVGVSTGVAGIIGVIVARIVDSKDYATNGGIDANELADVKNQLAGKDGLLEDIKTQWQADRTKIYNDWHTDVNTVRAQAEADVAKFKSDFAQWFAANPAPAITTPAPPVAPTTSVPNVLTPPVANS